MAKRHSAAKLLGKIVQLAQQLLAFLGSYRFLLRAQLRGVVLEAQPQCLTAHAGAGPIASLVGHDGHEPRTEGSAGIETIEGVERLHGAVLECVVGLGRRASDEVGHPVGNGGVTVHEQGEGDLIAFPCPISECRITVDPP